MIHSLRFTCVLDTNVIYPIDIRDLLFWFASFDLFTPKWSRHIFEECESVMKRKDVPINEIEKAEKIKRQYYENKENLMSLVQFIDRKVGKIESTTASIHKAFYLHLRHFHIFVKTK